MSCLRNGYVMDFLPQNTLILGATGGIGQALLAHLKDGNGVRAVNTLSRSHDGLDFSKPETIAKLATAHDAPDGGYDLIINTIGVLEIGGQPPEKAFSKLNPETMMEAYAINAVGPAMVFRHFTPFLARGRRAVFAHLSARVGSIGDNGLGGWMSYRASKAGLNQIIRCASHEIRRTRPEAICAALHPGTIETSLTRKFAAGRYTATAEGAAAQLLGVMGNLTPQDSGGFFDYKGEIIPW